jgi:hypothetical protein
MPVELSDQPLDFNVLVDNPPKTKEELVKLYLRAYGQYRQYLPFVARAKLVRVKRGYQKGGITWLAKGDLTLLEIRGPSQDEYHASAFAWRPVWPAFTKAGKPRWKPSGPSEPVGMVSCRPADFELLED